MRPSWPRRFSAPRGLSTSQADQSRGGWRQHARRLGRRPEGAWDGLAGAIYGQIVVLSVVAALEIHERAPATQTLAAVAVTLVVLWLAHLYADTLAHGGGWAHAAGVARRELPMVVVAVPTLLVLALGAVGALSRRHSVAASIAVGAVILFGLAAGEARRRGSSATDSLGVGAVAVALGLAIVALKTLFH